ncbi:lysozyme [Candidimonas nitroreducens]|uniref:Lysozyme n=1 Tax=Candidimonas nitroreducens TaxID=683354 RepID=A0A225M2C7_9BURK|nr:lysozyme [Candidimonas nitroreducens]OWT55276.1 lysozyme [Candidimonas nitroreducens]
MIPPVIKTRLLQLIAGGASAVAIAGALVGYFEGTSYPAYQDVNGTWTACRGHTGPDVIPHKVYTEAECQAFEDKDIAKATAAVHRHVKVRLSNVEEGALIDYTFNEGEGHLMSSTLLRKINAGDKRGACTEYRKWVLAGGRKYQGLVNRRDTEEWLCSMG